jgi:hypothetical protein
MDFGERQRCFDIRRLPYDRQVTFEVEHPAEPAPNRGVVVGEHDPDRLRGRGVASGLGMRRLYWRASSACCSRRSTTPPPPAIATYRYAIPPDMSREQDR